MTGSVNYHRWLDSVNRMMLFLPFSHATRPQECDRHSNTLTFLFCSFFSRNLLFPSPPSCIQFLCFCLGADYLISYRFKHGSETA